MKKLLCILLSLFIFTACSFSKNNNLDNNLSENFNNIDNNVLNKNSSGEYYLNLLKNYEVLDKDPNSSIKDNQEFDDFLNEVFKETIESSYLYMHFNLSDYKAMSLTKPSVDLGELVYGINTEDISREEEHLNKLNSFEYSSLSYDQQIDYDLYKYSLYETLCGYYFSKYALLFSPDTDLTSNLMTNLVEFPFYDEESIEDYLLILQDVSRYIDDAIAYTDLQVKDGILHTDYMLSDQIDYLDSVTTEDDNTIITSFNKAMDNVTFIDENKKDEYISKVKEYVINDVNPALIKLKDYLSNLETTSPENATFYALDPNYAQYKFIVSSSYNGDVNNILKELKTYYDELEKDYKKALSNDNALNEIFALYDSELLNSDYKTQLDYLKNNMDEKYTNIGDIDYVVSELDTLGSSTAAYYISSPLDNLNQNVIRVNANNSDSDVINNFEILAHEGFPGHLYQHIMFMKAEPHNFRHTQSFTGYTEGWADLASNDAFDLLSNNKLVLNTLKYASITTQSHILYSILTIKIQYYGCSLEEFCDYINNEFDIDSDYGETIYNYIVSIGDTYCIYGVGFITHLNIRQNAIDKLNDKFSYSSYHDTLLKNGPVPFVLLEQIVDNYINQNS